MKQILTDLNEEAGAVGSLVVTKDGILVASEISSNVEKDVASALSSFLITAIDRCLSNGGMGGMSRMVMVATHGKLILSSLGDYFLVLMTDQFVETDVAQRAAVKAARKLREKVKIQI